MTYRTGKIALKRDKSEGEKTLTGCLLLLMQLFLTPWIIMLFLGMLHHGISDAVPALGWWFCFVGVLVFRVVYTAVMAPFKRK